jgi:hypothetical protein
MTSPAPAPEYAAARRVLLDALTVLEPHLGNLVLVGSQAIYLHTGDGDLAVPPMTTDADLALNTIRLAEQPEIASALKRGHRGHRETAAASRKGAEFIATHARATTDLLPVLATSAVFGDPAVGPAFVALVSELCDSLDRES